jgi:ubiquinone/menaquinone biosynthesis C-methylase UbiE
MRQRTRIPQEFLRNWRLCQGERSQQESHMTRKTTGSADIRRRYDRIARFYDLMESPMEGLRFNQWRTRMRERVTGKRALEVGVGTGKNIQFYPPQVEVTAIDISPRMLERARIRATALGRSVQLLEMDVQSLGFPDRSFDTVFGSCVFCSVPDPIEGLEELHRVVKPDGKLILLEHMRPGHPVLGLLFDLLNPMVRMMGPNINRRTMDNIHAASWHVVEEEWILSDIVRWIEARP